MTIKRESDDEPWVSSAARSTSLRPRLRLRLRVRLRSHRSSLSLSLQQQTSSFTAYQSRRRCSAWPRLPVHNHSRVRKGSGGTEKRISVIESACPTAPGNSRYCATVSLRQEHGSGPVAAIILPETGVLPTHSFRRLISTARRMICRPRAGRAHGDEGRGRHRQCLAKSHDEAVALLPAADACCRHAIRRFLHQLCSSCYISN